MTEPRAVTLATLDHGEVTLVCPAWCVGHAAHVPVRLVDLAHLGHEDTLSFRGETLWTLMLGQHPYASHPEQRVTGLYVEQGAYAHTDDPACLDALAAAMVEHAAVLRARARELGMLLGGER